MGSGQSILMPFLYTYCVDFKLDDSFLQLFVERYVLLFWLKNSLRLCSLFWLPYCGWWMIFRIISELFNTCLNLCTRDLLPILTTTLLQFDWRFFNILFSPHSSTRQLHPFTLNFLLVSNSFIKVSARNMLFSILSDVAKH